MIKKIKIPKLKEANFLIVPTPLEGELFSSWFVRMSYAHKTHPHTFENLFLDLPKRLFSKNIDTSLKAETEKIIEDKCRNKIHIYPLTLQSYNTYLQEKIISNGTNKFITPLRYCPQCLKEDKIPYFRKEWKVTFSTICLKHNSFLHDACPNCSEKLNISKMFQNKYPYIFCHKCGFDFSNSKKLHIHYTYRHIRQYTKTLFDILERGYIKLGSSLVYSFHFFDVMAQLSKIILMHRKLKFIEVFIPLRTLQTWRNMKFKSISPAYTQISIKDQFMLFGAIVALFLNYPYNVRNYITSNQLTYWQTTKDMAYLPFWFETLINNIIPRYVPYSKIITDKEIKACQNYLLSEDMLVNKANLTKLLGCNFFSCYNSLNISTK